MKKNITTPVDPWNDSEQSEQSELFEKDTIKITSPEDVPTLPLPETIADLRPRISFSLAGLKADFTTANDLQQFVFDETQVSLKLKGIDPELKYEIALKVLNNEDVDPVYITGANPYMDNKELIPEDPIRSIPKRDSRLPNEAPMNIFHDMTVPHPETDMRAQDAKVRVCFRKYPDGSISYEIEGPLEKHAVGEKLDKYGRSRPEKYSWIDPRTGEQAVRLANGQYTKMGQRLRTLMESRKINRNASFWSTWIDRNFTDFQQDAVDNPWN